MSSLTSPLQSVVDSTLLTVKNGALLTAGTSVYTVVALRGGGASKEELVEPFKLSPKAKSVLSMALGMALHYLGYSFARSVTIALFTSEATGFPKSSFSFPLANALVSPTSLFLLMMYGRVLKSYGPRSALKRSTLSCASVIFLASLALSVAKDSDMSWGGFPITKIITAPLFVFRESYVQLLTSQYWSFMASVLTPDQSARWFAPIAGLTSISSAIGGFAVKHLTRRVGLAGTLACTGIALCSSLIATEAAYWMAEKHHFAPNDKTPKKVSRKSKNDYSAEGGLFSKATRLFARVPVLKALFFEILSSQGLATLLNICFVKVLSSIRDDTVRAGWVGNFYALINVISMSLQFGVLPMLMQVIEPRDLWRCIPIISLLFISFQACQANPSLYIVSGSLLVMKVLEYSARRMLDEMVYVPLDFESRFVGKEIIGVFGYRLGKSLMSLSLSGLTALFGSFTLQQLSVFCDIAAFAWAKAAWNLSSLVPTRKEAQDSYTAKQR